MIFRSSINSELFSIFKAITFATLVFYGLFLLHVYSGFQTFQSHVGVPTKKKLQESTTSSDAANGNSLFETALLETFSSERLKGLARRYAREFQSKTPFPHIYIDNFVEPALLKLVEKEFIEMNYDSICESVAHKMGIGRDSSKMNCLYKTLKMKGGDVFERNEYKKLAVYSEEYFGAMTRFLFLLFKSSTFTTFLEDISGIDNVIPDPHFRGSGLHSTAPRGFLRVHADFNRYERYKLDRRINVFLFLNSEWKEKWGGALELWPRNMSTCERKIQPIFNRLVIFRTTDFSYHGYTDPLTSPFPRRSMAMYYYTNGRPDEEKIGKGDHSHSTLWQEVPCKMQGLESLGPKCS